MKHLLYGNNTCCSFTISVVSMNETNVVDVNREVVEWLKAHPLVSRRGICKSISIDPGNFHRWVIGGTIPSAVLERLIPVLRLYGYGVEASEANGEGSTDELKKGGKKVQPKKGVPKSDERPSTEVMVDKVYPLPRAYDNLLRITTDKIALNALAEEVRENPHFSSKERKSLLERIDFKLNRLK